MEIWEVAAKDFEQESVGVRPDKFSQYLQIRPIYTKRFFSHGETPICLLWPQIRKEKMVATERIQILFADSEVYLTEFLAKSLSVLCSLT